MDILDYMITSYIPSRGYILNPTPQETPHYIIPTPNLPESPQNRENSQNLNEAPCIRRPKIAERPYQHPFPKNLKTPKLADFI